MSNFNLTRNMSGAGLAFPTLGSSPRTFFKDHQKCDVKYVNGDDDDTDCDGDGDHDGNDKGEKDLTSLSKREKRPEWFDVFNLKECELLLVATAIFIWGLTDRD